MENKTALILTEARNTPIRIDRAGVQLFKKDGDTFVKWTAEFIKWHVQAMPQARISAMRFSGWRKWLRRVQIFERLAAIKNLVSLTMFCHGWPQGSSLGLNTGYVKKLADAINAAVPDDGNRYIRIRLYACSMGRGSFWPGGSRWRIGVKNKKNTADRHESVCTRREGFALMLCYELNKRGVDSLITAHLTAGHAVHNPHKVNVFPRNGKICREYCRPISATPNYWKHQIEAEDGFKWDI